MGDVNWLMVWETQNRDGIGCSVLGFDGIIEHDVFAVDDCTRFALNMLHQISQKKNKKMIDDGIFDVAHSVYR